MNELKRHAPVALQVLGGGAVLVALAVLAGVAWAVLAGGAAAVALGTLAETDGA